jgi:hypothetical protein
MGGTAARSNKSLAAAIGWGRGGGDRGHRPIAAQSQLANDPTILDRTGDKQTKCQNVEIGLSRKKTCRLRGKSRFGDRLGGGRSRSVGRSGWSQIGIANLKRPNPYRQLPAGRFEPFADEAVFRD